MLDGNLPFLKDFLVKIHAAIFVIEKGVSHREEVMVPKPDIPLRQLPVQTKPIRAVLTDKIVTVRVLRNPKPCVPRVRPP